MDMNVMNALPAVQQLQGLSGLMQGGVLGTGEGGGFMDLILQLLAGNGEEAGGGMLDMLDALVDVEGEQKPEKDAQDLLMQMLGGMMAADSLFTNPQMIPDLMQVSPELAVQVMGVMQNQTAAPVQTIDPSILRQMPSGEEQVGDMPEEAVFEVLSVPEAGESAASQQKSSGEDALFWGGRFQDSVSQAQKLMKDGGEDTAPERVMNVEALQQDVDAGRFAPVRTEEELPLPEAKDVAEQVRTGILQNIGKGKNEFVVKLKPEGLGEITVHMAETGGKLALNIIASSQQTARLINAEIAGLRDSLRPYNADVHEVVSQQQYAADGGAQYRHPEQQNQSHRRQNPQRGYGSVEAQEVEEEQAVSGAAHGSIYV